MAAERRRACRIAFRNGVLPPRARVRPGCEVVLVNLSDSGALVEGPYRFRPESPCEISLLLDDADTTLRARIVRSFVARLDRQGPVRYRAALRFDRLVSIPLGLGHPDGYRIPTCPLDAPPTGVVATRDAASPRVTSTPKARISRHLWRR